MWWLEISEAAKLCQMEIEGCKKYDIDGQGLEGSLGWKHLGQNIKLANLIKPSQMEVAPLHRTFVISYKRRLFKNTKGI